MKHICTIAGIALFVLIGRPSLAGMKNDDSPRRDEVKKDDNLNSLHGYLSVSDLQKFQVGRAKAEILKELNWRAGWLTAGKCEGKQVTAIIYTLLVDPSDTYKQETFHAIFVDGKFVKFIRWLPVEMETIPYSGTTRTRAKPTKVDDCRWLIKAMNTRAVSSDELIKTAAGQVAPKKQVDIGLTLAWLMVRPRLNLVSASKDDFKRNASLRDQYNPARLDLDMTEEEVQRTFAKPLESGDVGGSACRVYGSYEAFRLSDEIHFTNVLVAFREKKAIKIESFPASQISLAQLTEGSLDPSKGKYGIIEYLKRRDAAADRKNSAPK